MVQLNIKILDKYATFLTQILELLYYCFIVFFLISFVYLLGLSKLFFF